MPTTAVVNDLDRLRTLVTAARSDATVGQPAEECFERLRRLYAKHPEAFTAEDIRWANKLRGFLGIRLAAHGGKKKWEKLAKRKGDKLDHCWRCETPVDERFTEICPTCDSKAYHWRVCPVCRACGCQREGKVLV